MDVSHVVVVADAGVEVLLPAVLDDESAAGANLAGVQVFSRKFRKFGLKDHGGSIRDK